MRTSEEEEEWCDICEEEWGDICEEGVDFNSEIEGTDVQDEFW